MSAVLVPVPCDHVHDVFNVLLAPEEDWAPLMQLPGD